jgi:hypothetical protein|tara:strand:- start:117 stop:572 length:456 start_codon:yes stop_codon:yes gene_type:complete
MIDKAIKALEGYIYWAKITVPNQYGKYSCELVLSDKDADYFESIGVPTINGTAKKQDGSLKTSDHYEGRAVVISRNINRKDGTPNIKPKLYDANGEQIDSIVWNGSKVTAKYRIWETENQFGHFVGLDLIKVRVDEEAPRPEETDFNDDDF